MSTIKLKFSFVVFFISALVFTISAIKLLFPTLEIENSAVYEESPEVTEYYRKFEENRNAAVVSIEESRLIASKWIQKEQGKISHHLFYRRRAYSLISKAILSSQTYDDLNSHLSRLPSTEKQAYTTLTIDRSSITTLDQYDSYIPALLYPIELPTRGNNGKDLLITSSYSSRRISPVGAGGARPHYAVDIINIGNIDYVTEDGELVREGNHPGYIVAVADGKVVNLEYNHVYGWNVTIEHDRAHIPLNNRSGIKSFETFYAHLNKLIYVNIGDELKAGDNIALVGNSGLSTGPHLHYEVRMNKYDGSQKFVNPFPGSEW